MSDDSTRLRGCPTCGTRVADAQLRLRDFRWANDKLPGKVGLMDIDGVLSSAKTGRTLMVEMKPPGGAITRGAQLTYKALAAKPGIDVIAMRGPYEDGTVEVADITFAGLRDWRTQDLDVAADNIAQWWARNSE